LIEDIFTSTEETKLEILELLDEKKLRYMKPDAS
jgi:hypothetical protein